MTQATFRVRQPKRLAGELEVPGDKAISHRALLIGAGCGGTIEVLGLSTARDVATTLAAVGRLGSKAVVTESNPQVEGFEPSSTGASSLKLEGTPAWRRWPQVDLVDCENSGTTMRLLMGILAGRPSSVELRGDSSLSQRPMRRVAEPLRLMGARVDLSPGGIPPVSISGGRLDGIEYQLRMASAQVKTAILLAGLQASGTTAVVEGVPTRDHTERMLTYLGAEVRANAGRISVEATQLLGDKEINIPGDFSSASFLLTAAALHQSGDVTIINVGLNPTRTAFLSVLERFGARVETGGVHDVSGEPRGWVRVRAGDRRAPWVEPAEIPSCIDELPLVAVLGAAAEGGTTEIRGAAELRVKESDRVAAIVSGLGALGARARALPDGFVVEGGGLAGGAADSFGDHRIAMALAVAGLAATGETVVSGWEAVGVSYPEFGDHLAALSA